MFSRTCIFSLLSLTLGAIAKTSFYTEQASNLQHHILQITCAGISSPRLLDCHYSTELSVGTPTCYDHQDAGVICQCKIVYTCMRIKGTCMWTLVHSIALRKIMNYCLFFQLFMMFQVPLIVQTMMFDCFPIWRILLVKGNYKCAWTECGVWSAVIHSLILMLESFVNN